MKGGGLLILPTKLIARISACFQTIFRGDQDKAATMELMSKGLLELAQHANKSKVTVLMETHGDLVKMAEIKR